MDYPFSSNRYSTKAHRLNWGPVKALAENEFSKDVIQDLQTIFSFGWNGNQGKYVPFVDDEKHQQIAATVNHDTTSQCNQYQKRILSAADPQASEILSQKLRFGHLPRQKELIDVYGLSADEIFRHTDIIVSKFGPKKSTKIVGSWGAYLNSPDQTLLFVSDDYSGLDYLLLASFGPGLSCGLYNDVGHMLNRIVVNYLINQKGWKNWVFTKIITDALEKNGLPITETFISALQGNPEKMYGAIEHEYGTVALGVLLLLSGSDFYEEETEIQRYGFCYNHALEYFEPFGYS